MLLPSGVSADGSRRTLSRSGGPVHPVLSADTFAVVALPGADREGGLRGLYTDASGRTWLAEEVTDPDRAAGTPPPPVTLVEETEEDLAAGPNWVLLGKDRTAKPKGP